MRCPSSSSRVPTLHVQMRSADLAAVRRTISNPGDGIQRSCGFPGSALSTLMLTAVLPPLVADQSDRAVVNAPVTLLTAPINGEVEQLTARPGSDVGAGQTAVGHRLCRGARSRDRRPDRATEGAAAVADRGTERKGGPIHRPE